MDVRLGTETVRIGLRGIAVRLFGFDQRNCVGMFFKYSACLLKVSGSFM